MAGVSIGAVEGLPDPLLATRFQLVISLPKVLTSLSNGFTPSSRELFLRCQQLQIPGVNIEPVTINLHGFELQRPGRTQFTKSMQTQFQETSDGYISKVLMRWKEAGRGSTSGNGAFHDDLTATAVASPLDIAGNPVGKWTIYKFWPQDIPDVQLDGASSQGLVRSATFAYDYFIHTDMDGNIIENGAGTSATY